MDAFGITNVSNTRSNHVMIGEGVDRAGKTTVLSALADITDIPYYKGERYPVTGETRQHVKMAENVQFANVMNAIKPDLIVDRFHLSELAYSMTFDRPINEDLMDDVDIKLANANGVIIFFDTPIEVCMTRLPPFSQLTLEHYKSLRHNYHKLLAWTRCPVVLITPTDLSTTETMVKYITTHLGIQEVF